MKNTLCLLLFITCMNLFFSCTRKVETRNNGTVVLDNKTKENAISLKGDTIKSMRENIFAYNTRVYKDSILIIRNWSSSPHLMELRRLKDNSLIKKCLVKGNGPGEALSFQYENFNENTIVAYDVIKGNYSFINIDSLINVDSYKINFTKLPNSILQNVNKINETLVFSNPYIYSNKIIDIDFIGERFIKESELKKLNEYREKCTILPHNVNQGFVLSNNEKKRIAFFSKGQPICEIYDSNLKLICKIEGPDSFDEQKIRIRSDDYKSLVYSGSIPWAYTDVFSNSHYIYAVYLGKMIKSKDYDNNLRSTSGYIFQFDWNGNLINCFKSKDYITAISVSNNGETIYANVFNKAGESKIVKFDIQK